VPRKVSTVKLNQLMRLSKRKEALLAQIQNIDRRMVQLEQEFRLARRRKNRNAELTVSSGKKRRGFKLAQRKGG
jgi:flagellar biosynthesis/type III secretory pathway chaperone